MESALFPTPFPPRPKPAALALGLVAWLAGAAGAPLAAQAQAVQSPAPGVVCDARGLRGGGVCYDSGGVSLPLTARYLGRGAATQLSAYLTTNPAPLEFRLSNGTVCNLSARTCWEDGWSKSNVAERLTRQLFGASGATNPGLSGEGWTPPNVSRDTGLCSLTRGGRPVFDGRCDLRQMNQGDSLTRYRVRLANGTTYVFANRGGTFTIADDFGSTWPVTYLNHGATGICRWAEMSLVATQMAGRDASTASGAMASPSDKDDLGRALGTLLNTLCR